MIKPLLVTILLGSSLSACVLGSMHNNPAMEEINSLSDVRSKVRIGMSMEQVEQALGKPNSVSVQNSTTLWHYASRSKSYGGKEVLTAGLGGYVPSRNRSVMISFNSRGRVSQRSYNDVTL